MPGEVQIKYRPEIDGLRAWVVVPVLLFHAGFGFPGGYAGVDVFFVISGYLIGSLILKEAATGNFHFGHFWMRRIRRLFPAWAVVLVATTIGAAVWLVPPYLAEYGRSLVSQPLMWANFHFWEGSGYFETASEFQPLLHTWSLAVEEQFYVVLPLVLLPLMRFSRRVIPVVAIGVTIGSFVFSLHAMEDFPSLAFFLLPARLWELNLGVLLALVPSGGFTRRWMNEAAGLLGLVLIGFAYAAFDSNTAFPGPWALLPCLGTFLFLFGTSGGLTLAGRFTSVRPLVWIGKISYPLYLWHWPVIVFVKYHWINEPSAPILIMTLIFSTVLAWATYEWIERPVRTGLYPGYSRRLAGVAAMAALGFVVSELLWRRAGDFPNGFPPR